MTGKLPYISSSLIVQHRPLTKIALDNKIRAIISQFHPRERQFALVAHEITLDRIYTINSSRNHCVKSKLPYSSIITDEHFVSNNRQKNEYIYIDEKVTQWLESLDYDR